MPKRPRPDLDERFSLHPMEGEEVLRELLRDADESDDKPGDMSEPPDTGEPSSSP